MQQSTSRVWLITGASRGLGRAFMEIALEAGDRVVSLSRTGGAAVPKDFGKRVLHIATDVTDRLAVFAAVDQAIEHFQRVDIVVNNAGALAWGFLEEFDEAAIRTQFDLNVFGAIWVTQAALPHLRRQRSGHIVQISSIGGLIGWPMSGVYNASKFALEGLSEALAGEVAPFGIKLTIVEPGGYWTGLYSAMTMSRPIEAYAEARESLQREVAEASVDSDPRLAAMALMKVVNDPEPPLRVVLGSAVFDMAMEATRRRLEVWSRWENVSRAAEDACVSPGTGP